MGYTHYWRRPAKLDPEKFAAFAADCRKVCEAVPIPLGDWEGKGEPEFSRDMVSFNGSVHSESFARDGGGLMWPTDDAENVATVGQTAKVGHWFAGDLLSKRAVDENGDGSYESFVIERAFEPYKGQEPDQDGRWFAFCKTNYRPYDLCVQFCLIALKEHFGGAVVIRSDGTDKQWNEARDGCQVYLGYGLLFELHNEPAPVR